MTNIVIPIEQAPYSLRPRGSRTYEVIFRGEVIGEMRAFQRMEGRTRTTQYKVDTASGGTLGVARTVEDAADRIYDARLKAECAGSGVQLSVEDLLPRQVEFVARMFGCCVINSTQQAEYALKVWAEMFDVDVDAATISQLLIDAVRKVQGL